MQVISKYNYLAIKQIKSKYMGQECNLLMSDSIKGDTHFNKLPLAVFGLPWQRKLLQTFCAVKNIVRSVAEQEYSSNHTMYMPLAIYGLPW